MPCPRCAVTSPEGVRFCEACGENLAPESPSIPAVPGERCRCGAGPEAKGNDGYCAVCGLRWPVAREPLPRDHVELRLSDGFAGVTDRGKRHVCNEDALALALGGVSGSAAWSILVVCDGVSSSQRADEASEIAAQTACAALLNSVKTENLDTEAAVRAAIQAGHEAACTLQSDPEKPKDPPGATIVVGLVRAGSATLGWLGDSRAYWIGTGEARLLTHDHSWVNAVVDSGEMLEEEALKSPEAHAITRCLGPLNGDAPGESPEPTIITVPLTGPGMLLLCTDGLWNYAPETEQIAGLVRRASAGGDAMAACRVLIEYAISKGGRDNITAALLSW